MIVLDTNIILEILEKRKHYQKVIDFLEAHQTEQTAISALTLSNVFYLVEGNAQNITVAEELLRKFIILDVNGLDAAWAFDNYAKKDFEDALQVASSIRHKTKYFVTIDKSLAKKYKDKLNIILIK